MSLSALVSVPDRDKYLTDIACEDIYIYGKIKNKEFQLMMEKIDKMEKQIYEMQNTIDKMDITVNYLENHLGIN